MAERTRPPVDAIGMREPATLSEQDRRALWSSVINQMIKNKTTLTPYFATYGSTTELGDQRTLVIRYPDREFGPVSYIAITTDGPFALVTDSKRSALVVASDLNDKLREDAKKTNKGGYTVERDGDNITRTISLGEEAYTFRWSSGHSSKTPTLRRVAGHSIRTAIDEAVLSNERYERLAIRDLLEMAVETTGIPQRGSVPMWEDSQPPI